MPEAVIASATRTAIGAFLGKLAEVHPKTFGSLVIKEVVKRAGLKPEQVEEVVMGCILQAGLGQNIARQCALEAGIPVEVPAMTINMVCGSGLRAVVQAAQRILLGEADIIVAGGVESMSRAPYLLESARNGYRMGHGELVDSMIKEGLTCALVNVHMGLTAENVAAKYNVTRQEQDQFAYESQMKAAKAISEGRFKDEIVPVLIPQKKGEPVVFDTDEHPKPQTTIEKLATLKPAFKPDGTVTAGNASGINDGAAAVVVMSDAKARELGLEPMARIRGYAFSGIEPDIMGIGPVPAVKKLLEKTGVNLDQIDLIEANEAFAAQSVAVGKLLGFDKEKLNVNGGAIALGHPVGASGTRILVTLLYEMQKRNSKLGLATLCIGGGMGIGMLVER